MSNNEYLNELQNKQQLLSNICDQVPFLLIIRNCDGSIFYANKRACDYFELDSNFITESGAERLGNIQSYISDDIAGSDIILNDTHTGKWFIINNTLIQLNNKTDAWLQTIYDITAFKKRELELEKQANTDSMTGVRNRRSALLYLNTLIENIDELEAISVIFIDMDNLKIINDYYGHSQGDSALLAVSDVVSITIQHDDCFYRIGGDEFLIILSKCTKENAHKVVDRIQAAIDRYNKSDNLKFNISISCGVAETTQNHKVTADELLAKADSNMYAVKREKKKMCSNLIHKNITLH